MNDKQKIKILEAEKVILQQKLEYANDLLIKGNDTIIALQEKYTIERYRNTPTTKTAAENCKMQISRMQKKLDNQRKDIKTKNKTIADLKLRLARKDFAFSKAWEKSGIDIDCCHPVDCINPEMDCLSCWKEYFYNLAIQEIPAKDFK